MNKQEIITLPANLREELISRMRLKLDGSLEKIILFGSCARGDASVDSDIDFIALIRDESANFKEIREILVDIAFDLSLENNVDVSILPQDFDEYQKWLPYIPFYQNIGKEGIVVYERSR